ncbi:MAG: hypothetical protein COU69_03790 [Candidatus Pacebacteria bacterium CG10_big_fil_rev_8_21_14_0_10_56_10]|nr:MAG: hypothetical protein COU69_03790 [Candidatus Pacebacteria bacterium CG10_big_fil_rev_8_21_14_0_10_56_10]
MSPSKSELGPDRSPVAQPEMDDDRFDTTLAAIESWLVKLVDRLRADDRERTDERNIESQLNDFVADLTADDPVMKHNVSEVVNCLMNATHNRGSRVLSKLATIVSNQLPAGIRTRIKGERLERILEQMSLAVKLTLPQT